MKVAQEEIILQGIPISKGISIGVPYFFEEKPRQIEEFQIEKSQIEDEINRYRGALHESRKQIKKLQKNLPAIEIAEILETHLQMLHDPMITSNVEQKIRTTSTNSESVFHLTISKYKKQFNEIKDPFFKERIHDINDVSGRILRNLMPGAKKCLLDTPSGSIILADVLIPSDIVEADSRFVYGFVTNLGGQNSHSAIISKSKGIPYVANIDIDFILSLDGGKIIIDGEEGIVIVNPTKQTYENYLQKQSAQKSYYESLEHVRYLPSETIDGYQTHVYGNLETLEELNSLSKSELEGIGLFRSEYLFFMHSHFPTEEEQFTCYRNILESMQGSPVVIRIFDLGADKPIRDNSAEDLSILGCRAIRFLLKTPEILNIQIRALLRSSFFGNLRILVPMICDIGEFVQVKQKIYEIKKELEDQGVSVAQDIQVGCMVEVPSLVFMIDAIAKEADFLSIGSNDLIQYTLAASRDDPEVSYLHSDLHPSILRLLSKIMEGARKYHKKVTLCGEMGTDEKLIPLFIGIGINNFSISKRRVPVIKSAIRKVRLVDAYYLAEKALQFTTSKELKDFLKTVDFSSKTD